MSFGGLLSQTAQLAADISEPCPPGLKSGCGSLGHISTLFFGGGPGFGPPAGSEVQERRTQASPIGQPRLAYEPDPTAPCRPPARRSPGDVSHANRPCTRKPAQLIESEGDWTRLGRPKGHAASMPHAPAAHGARRPLPSSGPHKRMGSPSKRDSRLLHVIHAHVPC